MGDFGLPEGFCVEPCPPPGSVEVTIGDLPPIPAPFMGPEMCPPDCGEGPAYQEVRKCSDDPEDGQSDVLVGSYVDGVWTPGAAVPAGYVPCSTCPDQVEVTTKAPTWESLCVGWCEDWRECVTTLSDGAVVRGPWQNVKSGEVVAEAPGPITGSSCPSPIPITQVLSELGEDGCPVVVGVVELLQFGPKVVTSDLEPFVPDPGVIVTDEQLPVSCRPCPVDQADFYEAGSVAWLSVYADGAIAELDCDTGVWSNVPTVIVDGVEFPVVPGCPWSPPVEGCLFDKDIEVVGPHTDRVWTIEKDCG